MRLLVVGDLHLSDNERIFESLSAHIDGVDVIITIGDIVDHSMNDGSVGERFYRSLDNVGVPVLSIPGNHDFRIHDRLLNKCRNVRNLHLSSTQVNEHCFIGFGSDRFDDGVEIRKPLVKQEVTADDLDTTVRHVRERNADSKATDPVPRNERIDKDKYIDYHKRYEELKRLNTHWNEEQNVVVTHVPPFNTDLDTIVGGGGPRHGLHWGSLALKHFVEDYGVSLVLSGHVHEGEGSDCVDGTKCVNIGYRKACIIERENGTYIVRREVIRPES